jgi:hypothetical protein
MVAAAIQKKQLQPNELADLVWAYQHLEHPSFAARLSNLIGSPIEQGFKLLPKSWYQRLDSAVESSIRKALNMAIGSMEHFTPNSAHLNFHKAMAVGTGALGGFFGPITLLAELPVMTILMLRTIADIAVSEGEDLSQDEAKMACMEVFALGGRSTEDDAAESGYYSIRAMISFHFSSALMPLAEGNPQILIPGGVEFIRAVAARFGVVIKDKAAARIIPAAGAVSGALLNLLFMKHFQDMGRGHFIVRRLERKYGADFIHTMYENIAKKEAEGNKHYSNLEGW